MSQGYRDRVRETKSIWDSVSAEEKEKIMEWCPISDEIMREQYGKGVDIDAQIDRMTDTDFAAFHNAVMRRYRLRKQKRASTIKMLRAEGTGHANAQADKLEAEQKADDEETAKQEEEVTA